MYANLVASRWYRRNFEVQGFFFLFIFLILKCKNVSIPGCDLVLGMVQKGLVSHVHQHRGLEVGSNNPNGRKKNAKKEGGKKGLLEWKKQRGKKIQI